MNPKEIFLSKKISEALKERAVRDAFFIFKQALISAVDPVFDCHNRPIKHPGPDLLNCKTTEIMLDPDSGFDTGIYDAILSDILELESLSENSTAPRNT